MYGGRGDVSSAIASIRKRLDLIAHVAFDDIAYTTTRGHDAYTGVMLSYLSPSKRGDVLEYAVRRFLEVKLGAVSHDAPRTASVNGRMRGKNRTTCDFLLNGRRVEVKSTQLYWNKCGQKWVAMWSSVKRNEYDDLYLALYTPTAVHVYEHDHATGVSSSGRNQHASGGRVFVCASRNVTNLDTAIDAIASKLRPMHVATLRM